MINLLALVRSLETKVQMALDRVHGLVVGGVNGTGWWHSTGSVLDFNAQHGSVAGQTIITNAGVTDAPFVTIAKDATLGANGFLTVVGLQGNTILATTPLVGEVLSFDGTFWGPTSPLGGTWHATVTAGTFSPNPAVNGTADLMIPFNCTGGAVIVNTPPAPYDGMTLMMKPVVASATPGRLHANNGGGETVEDPSNSGSFGADGSVPGQGAACWWKYRASDKKWIGLIGV